MPAGKITLKELNRATLARQMLLERKDITPLAAVGKLCGMQAQMPRPPFLGLWTRLANFQPEKLSRLLERRKIVRASMMRCTIHLVTASDYLAFRPCLQGAFTKAMHGVLGRKRESLDVEDLVRGARKAFKTKDMTFKELGSVLGPQWPQHDPGTIRYAVRTHLPLVQVPTDHKWSFSNRPSFGLAEPWLGHKLDFGLDETATLFRRYLASFGPASIADFRMWSGLSGCQNLADREHGKLVEFVGEDGPTLFDLPRAPRPKSQVEAPVRFLPDYDNLILAHADRRRVVRDDYRSRLCLKNLRILPTFLVDGMVAGSWSMEGSKHRAELTIEAFHGLSGKVKADLKREGKKMLSFAFPDAAKQTVQWT